MTGTKYHGTGQTTMNESESFRQATNLISVGSLVTIIEPRDVFILIPDDAVECKLERTNRESDGSLETEWQATNFQTHYAFTLTKQTRMDEQNSKSSRPYSRSSN